MQVMKRTGMANGSCSNTIATCMVDGNVLFAQQPKERARTAAHFMVIVDGLDEPLSYYFTLLDHL